MENKEVAKILRETAQLLEIDGAIIGRYRSYEKVAELLYSLPDRIEDIAKDDKKLRELPGIGEGMAEHIREILKTGDYALRQKLLKKYPPTLLDVMQLQGLGPKKTAILWKKFKAATVADVEKLAREEKLRDLDGFGEKSEQNILKATAILQEVHRALPARPGLRRSRPHVRLHPRSRRRGRIGHAGRLLPPRPRDHRRSRFRW